MKKQQNKLERVTDITQLKPGDKILYVGQTTEQLEFLCVHPHNDLYSLFLDRNLDGTEKFYNHRLKNEEWFRCTDGMANFVLAKRIEWYKARIEALENFLERKQ